VRIYWSKVYAYAVIIVLGVIWAFPIYSLILGSIKSLAEVMNTPIFVPPDAPSLSTLASVANAMKTTLLNTAIVVIPVAVLSTFFGMLGAYAIVRRRSKLSDTLMMLVAIATYTPYQALLVPFVHILKFFNLYNTLPGLAFGFLIYYTPMAALLMVIFMSVIPSELIEAAVVDGANEFSIFKRVVLPVLGPGIVSTLIFILIVSWNNFFIPLILTRGYGKFVTLRIFSYVGQSGTFYNKMFAAALLGSLPPLIIFIVLGRYFIRGLLVLGTGAKG